MNIEPTEGSRDGWAYKTFKAIGTCQSARKDGTTALYHAYGVRDEELFVQYQGFIDAEGCIWGVSLLASSMDSEAYFWCPRASFERVCIDGETEPVKVAKAAPPSDRGAAA
jgi:hypothetical protein